MVRTEIAVPTIHYNRFADQCNLIGRLNPMEINIEDEETLQLACELADLTGETMEEAITTALRIKLEKLKGQLKQEGRVTDHPAG